MRKPNYNMERKGRESAKQAKAAAKMEKRAIKDEGSRQPEAPTMDGHADPAKAGTQQSDD